jgi:valyl-tRNA synthetase
MAQQTQQKQPLLFKANPALASHNCSASWGLLLFLAVGPYASLDRFVARDKLWKDMEAAGLVVKKEAYTTR